MGELIDHPYRHFSPELIERLIAAGHLVRLSHLTESVCRV
jgi:hypothetical protein